MKKIIAILLVVTLMSALFIVPAYANEADGVISPRYDPNACPVCRNDIIRTTKTYREGYSVRYCDWEVSAHYHTHIYGNAIYDVCTSCGYNVLISKQEITDDYCPYR